MKFWTALRWLVSVLFLATVFLGWLGSDPKTATTPGATDAVRAVPNMIR